MKELTKKILESGLVDKHTTRAMEKWGLLDEGASDLVGKRKITEKSFEEFAEDIEVLLEKEQGQVRETQFEVSVTGPFKLKAGDYKAACYRDVFGRYLINDPNIDPFVRGEWIEIDGKEMELLDVEVLFKGDSPAAVQLVVDEKPLM